MLGTSLYPTVAPLSGLFGWVLAVVVALVVASVAIGFMLLWPVPRPMGHEVRTEEELEAAA